MDEQKKKQNKEKYTVQLCKGLKEKLDLIIKNSSEGTYGAIKISYYEASFILDKLIDKAGGIKGKIKIV